MITSTTASLKIFAPIRNQIQLFQLQARIIVTTLTELLAHCLCLSTIQQVQSWLQTALIYVYSLTISQLGLPVCSSCSINSPGHWEQLLFRHLLFSAPLMRSQCLGDNTLYCRELAGELEQSPAIHSSVSKLYVRSLEEAPKYKNPVGEHNDRCWTPYWSYLLGKSDKYSVCFLK